MPVSTLPTTAQMLSAGPTTGTAGKTDVLNTCLTLLTSAWGSTGLLAFKNQLTGTTDLTASGTPSGTTFLRGDWTWGTPAGGSGGGIADAANDSSYYLRHALGWTAANGTLIPETRGATNYTAVSGTVDGHLAGVDTALGTLAGSVGGGGTGLTVTAIQTANFSAAVNTFVRTNTTAGSFTVTLPASPTDGAEIVIDDSPAAGAWAGHPLSVAPNTKTIAGSSSTLVLGWAGGRIALRYSASGTDWKIVRLVTGQPLQAGNNLSEVVAQTAANNIITGVTVPQHFFTEQAAKTVNYTLVATDSGTQIPANIASAGVITVPTYSSAFKGFACDVYAVAAVAITATTSGSMALAIGESAHVRARNSTWKVARITDSAFV